MTTMEELMKEALVAPEERRAEAIRVLRGEAPQSAGKPTTGPLLMGMSAAAKFVGLSRATLWRACRAGRIQKVELFPGSYRIRREDLEALAAGKLVMRARRSRREGPMTEDTED